MNIISNSLINKYKKTNKYKYPISAPIFDSKEVNSALESILKLQISQGVKVAEFEKKFRKYIGANYAVATNSGSSANLLALQSLKEIYNLKKNDEVIIPSTTFATVVMPILQLDLKPVLLDVSSENFNIIEKNIENAITKKTKILMIVHTLGLACNMDIIQQICKKKNILLFEDCCEAHGSTFRNKKVGSFGIVSAFSFFVAHNMTTGDGGMVLTKHKKIYERVKSLREFGRTQDVSKRWVDIKNLKDFDVKYIFNNIGYNMRMGDIQASFGIEQLKKLDKFNNIRNINAKFFDNYFNSKFAKKFFKITTYNRKLSFHSYYTYPITIVKNKYFKRIELLKYLEKKGIETRPIFCGSIPDQPFMQNVKYKKNKLTNSKYIRDNSFFIGVHPGLSQNDLKKIINIFNSFIKKL